MSKLDRLHNARKEILQRIALIEEMRRGSVIRQFLKSKRKGASTGTFVGPYALYTCKRDGRTVGRRLHDPELIRRLEHQVENHHAFQRLCRKLVEVSEEICDEKEKQRAK